jgi:hypothetical protein
MGFGAVDSEGDKEAHAGLTHQSPSTSSTRRARLPHTTGVIALQAYLNKLELTAVCVGTRRVIR